MKLINMKCPNCGAKLTIDKDKENAVCQYCNQSFYIDDEKDPAPIIQINIEKSEKKASTAYQTDGSVNINKIASIFIAIVFIIIMIFGMNMIRSTYIFSYDSDSGSSEEYRFKPESAAMCEFTEKVFGKDVEDISKKEYASIKAVRFDKDESSDKVPWIFSYSFEVDENGTAKDMKKITLSDTDEIDLKDLQAFSGLQYIYVGSNGRYNWNGEYSNLYDFTNLKDIKAFYIDESISKLEYAFANPEQIVTITANIYQDYDLEILKKFTGIRSLNMPYMNHTYITDLDFLTVFRNLNDLSLNFKSPEKWDLSPLSALVNLKKLKISGTSNLDLQGLEVLKGMPMIETLELEDIKQLRALNFIDNMPHLDALSVKNCPINDISPLKNKISLQSLSLINCDEIGDISAVATLSNLQNFEYKSYSKIPKYVSLNNSSLVSAKIPCEIADMLSGALNLEKLVLTGSNGNSNTNFLPSLRKLKTLEFDSSASIFYSTSLASQIAASSIESVKGMSSHLYDNRQEEQDASPIFADSSLRSLIFPNNSDDYTAFEVSLSKIKDNNNIKVLDMSNCYIRNIDERGDRPFFVFDLKPFGSYANQLLKHFKAVEDLKVRDCNLDNIEFVKNMPNLKSIDLSDNYVQDLSPLKACMKLEKVICKNNSIANANVLPNTVEITD